MKKITTAAVVTVVSGQIKLSAAQAKTRLSALATVDVKEDGAGIYTVLKPIQFKAGETFGYDGEVRKDGILRDPQAEELARLEADQAVEARLRAELEPRLRDEITAEILAALKPETAGVVQAELAELAAVAKK